ncbi:VOC family protein [Marinirhabdus gelatinilytica]|uniref:Putative 3-demethylubiquinone-9 3-methyltransferase (Glyoxalase superfamily) n=1 Tax=Marinirhabdus gelatinilytica TaxID=1703343 RepID=A0A370QC54_9FLAO|nr:VOC family protein [Marinirhabdus gelatinilytica]RDK85580.1 putative 3-demethylubiquinone-9 3-methyltransferase (glyoxalase superfamily) [Marinirhabdus gelatinilytica]
MKTTTFLTFVGDQCGKAEEAMHFYASIFPNSEIKNIQKYADGEAGGTPELIKHGVFTLNGTHYMVSESNYNHAWSFTPAVSIFISDTEGTLIQELFEELSSNGGQVMVPLENYKGEGDYGFGKKFGWCEDKYGISWQFVLLDQ